MVHSADPIPLSDDDFRRRREACKEIAVANGAGTVATGTFLGSASLPIYAVLPLKLAAASFLLGLLASGLALRLNNEFRDSYASFIRAQDNALEKHDTKALLYGAAKKTFENARRLNFWTQNTEARGVVFFIFGCVLGLLALHHF
jgi:hypothetical protein